ncbi:MAG: peptidoglycan -binding protein [Silicimonas sp.]|nr:peptidoglycan -binding protein [Silicimonas sp.]
MALSRRSQRMSGSIWPGFVDAMTALLLVLMFVLTIFMIVQAIQRETITGQESELNQLTSEITALSQALGLSQQTTARLEDDLSLLQDERSRQDVLIANLTGQIDDQARAIAQRDASIASFEERVATLLAERDQALAEGTRLAANVEELEAAQERLITEQEAAQLALARARDEIDAQAEQARLAAAQREALEAMTAQLRAEAAEREQTLAETQEALTAEEQSRLAEAAIAEALRERLQDADAELTAMSLALEEQRGIAEDTLTMLAAANAVEDQLNAQLADVLLRLESAESGLSDTNATAEELRNRLAVVRAERDRLRAEAEALQGTVGQVDDLRDRLANALAAKLAAETSAEEQMSERERQETLLATARRQLAQEESISEQAQLQVEALNQQVAALRAELDGLQGLLDSAAEQDAASQIRIEALGSQLNQALARAASEERRRAELEAAEAERLRQEAERLGAEVQDLADYRSEFFGTLRRLLGDREGIQIVGDRFVFSSEVLFESASATLSGEGREQIAQVAGILSEVADQIPPAIDWIIRVDGHTDNVPLSGTGEFTDNWELSQARALSVVRYLTDSLGFPPQRLAATGFGEYRPVNPEDTVEARAQNRRIEFKLTER